MRARNLVVLQGLLSVQSFIMPNDSRKPRWHPTESLLPAQKAGTFFNTVPSDDSDNNNENPESGGLEDELSKLLEQRRRPKSSEPSTINGVPTSQASGFSKKAPPVKASKPYIGIGQRPPVNNPIKPEYDDQGYTLYQDEQTGEKSRVFEALVEYPTLFKMKIVGLNEGLFVEEMVALVAESCQVADVGEIQHSVKINGKWSSITVNAPVQSADMLYALYENVDRDPRVKFKF